MRYSNLTPQYTPSMTQLNFIESAVAAAPTLGVGGSTISVGCSQAKKAGRVRFLRESAPKLRLHLRFPSWPQGRVGSISCDFMTVTDCDVQIQIYSKYFLGSSHALHMLTTRERLIRPGYTLPSLSVSGGLPHMTWPHRLLRKGVSARCQYRDRIVLDPSW